MSPLPSQIFNYVFNIISLSGGKYERKNKRFN